MGWWLGTFRSKKGGGGGGGGSGWDTHKEAKEEKCCKAGQQKLDEKRIEERGKEECSRVVFANERQVMYVNM